MSLSPILQKLKEVATPEVFKTGILKGLLDIPDAVLAGGSIRDTIGDNTPKDYDIFFTNMAAHREVLDMLQDRDFSCTAETAYTQTLEKDGIVVQLIFKKAYASMQEIIKDFDFTPVMFAIGKDGIAVGEKTIEDLGNKYCRVNVITKPLSSLNRLVKYQDLKYDTKDAYDYILSVMQTQLHGIILGGADNSFYNHDESGGEK